MKKILDMDTILTFGKHKGKPFKELINHKDISYIYWLITATDWKFTDDIKDAISLFQMQNSAHRAYVKSIDPNYKHEAAYGQAFDNCMGHY